MKSGNESGTSLIETAVVLPALLLMLCAAVDFGYYYLIAANLVSSSRNAVLYSAQGYTSPLQGKLPSAGTAGSLADTAGVAGLVAGDLSGLANMATQTTVEVCSKSIGIVSTGTGNITKCKTFPSGTLSFTPDQDPEQTTSGLNPGFLTQRVDVVFNVQPLIPINFFSFHVVPPAQFHWNVEMRTVD